jgi:hypothetical protein
MYLFKICGIIFLVILAVSLMVLGLIYQDPLFALIGLLLRFAQYYYFP